MPDTKKLNICVLGGTGFVGRHLTAKLCSDGHHVRILTRHRERHRALLVLPTVQLVQADIQNESELAKHFAGQDVVINLVGILNEPGRKGKGFQQAHVELTQKVVQACEKNRVTRLLHMSALNATADPQAGTSHYLHSKGQAEELVHVIKGMNVTSFRPSVIFGPGDSFFNRFYSLLKNIPFFFPLACANAKFAPVYVGDVVEAFVHSLHDARTYGKRYDLCGPKVYTLKELVNYAGCFLPFKRRVIALGTGLSKLQAMLLEFAPGKPFTRDNFKSMQTDSVCKGPFPAIFGIKPHSVEEIVPQYLSDCQQRGRYPIYRCHSRRD
ncbi:MAG: complex I NDUFA9 subunit family protein [Gammaproteobacteria bacterium]|nr:complex I NDUFA9 subunit family protein [Gammaproteobacteria bacterium]MDH5654018.1 complex I NDUFA9 subunit family protein [Gammaproteobacteria bacterium]